MFILLLSVPLTYNLNQEIYEKQKIFIIIIKKFIYILTRILKHFRHFSF